MKYDDAKKDPITLKSNNFEKDSSNNDKKKEGQKI